MYEKFYRLRERPFALTPDPDYLYWRDCRAIVERYPWTGERRPPE